MDLNITLFLTHHTQKRLWLRETEAKNVTYTQPHTPQCTVKCELIEYELKSG